MRRAAADVVAHLVSGAGGRGRGAALMRRDVNGVFTGEEHPSRGAGPKTGVRHQRRRIPCSGGRTRGVSQSKGSHLFDVNVVVEVDEISSLRVIPGDGTGGRGGRGGGVVAAGLRGR